MRYLTILALTALALLLLLLPAHADNCRPVVRTFHGHKPTVVIAEPVAVPPLFPYPVLFQFISPPSTPPPAVISGALLPTALASYGAPSASAPAPDALSQRLDRLETLLARLGSGGGAQNLALPPVAWAEGERPPTAGAPAPPAPPARADAQRMTRSAQPTTGSAQPTASSAYLAPVAQLLAQRCQQCHAAPGRGNVDLFDLAGAFNPNVSADDIWRAVARDRMPKTPGNKLTPEEKGLVKGWRDAEERR